MIPEFEIRGLSVWYSSKKAKALDKLELQFSNEQINIILGQNGSGKSSLLRCLAGMQRWNEGEILRRGVSRQVDNKNFNEGLISISEDISLPRFKLKDLAELYSSIWSQFDMNLFSRIIDIGEISVEKRCFQLSRGQKILAQFALGLGTRSRTILVDEVTAALDPYNRRRVAEELIDYQKTFSATIVLATNIATEFNNYNAKIVLLKNGKIYLQGLFSDLRDEFIKIKVSSERTRSLPDFVPVSNVTADTTILIGRRGAISPTHEMQRDLAPVTMEEIFIYVSDRGRQ